jgi:hypothetical protein
MDEKRRAFINSSLQVSDPCVAKTLYRCIDALKKAIREKSHTQLLKKIAQYDEEYKNVVKTSRSSKLQSDLSAKDNQSQDETSDGADSDKD